MEVYLDYAATAPLRSEVLEAMTPLLTQNFANPDSLHRFGQRAAYALAEARASVAETLGVSPTEVYFTSGGTEADNWAVRCLGTGSVLLSPVEHEAARRAAAMRTGGSSFCKIGADGVLRAEDVADAMTADTGLVCAMAVNNETGCIQPVREIAACAHARGALLFCDCVQAACTQDLKQILHYADAVSLSAHKMGGPKGAGALVVKKGAKLSPLIAGGEQERSLRGGTVNVAGAVGLARALFLAQDEREMFCTHTQEMRALFEARLCYKFGLLPDGARRAPNISHFTFARDGGEMLAVLDRAGVACSGGAACSAHASAPSHVMLAMGRSPDEAKRGIRFSFGRETSREEVFFAVDTLISILS